MREKGADRNDLLDRLAADDRLKLSRSEIEALVADRLAFTGAAGDQVRAFVDRVALVATAHPHAAEYDPEEIL